MTTIEAYSTRPLGIATCRPCDNYSVRVLILIYQTRERWSAGGRLSTTCVIVMVGRVTRKTKKKKKASSVSNYFSRRAPTYIQRVRDEGGFANLARLHLNKLTETFAPKFAGRLPPEIVRHVVSFWLHAGYYDEGAETVDEAKYDSLIADITRKVDEMASLKVVPRASRRARKLRHALEADLDSDDDWTPCS